MEPEIFDDINDIPIDHNGEGTCFKMWICPIFIGLIILIFLFI